MTRAETMGWLIALGAVGLVSLVAAGLALMDGERGWCVVLTLNTAVCTAAMVTLDGVQ